VASPKIDIDRTSLLRLLLTTILVRVARRSRVRLSFSTRSDLLRAA